MINILHCKTQIISFFYFYKHNKVSHLIRFSDFYTCSNFICYFTNTTYVLITRVFYFTNPIYSNKDCKLYSNFCFFLIFLIKNVCQYLYDIRVIQYTILFSYVVKYQDLTVSVNNFFVTSGLYNFSFMQ